MVEPIIVKKIHKGGRVKMLPKNLKIGVSIRIYNKDLERLVENYGSVQKAINILVEFWSFNHKVVDVFMGFLKLKKKKK